MAESNAYILGTDREELHRLGVQHEVWSGEAHRGWELAQFKDGQSILDLGSGPGFCSTELAFITGEQGKVISVDKSAEYLDYLSQISDHHQLNIETILSDITQLELEANSLDAVWCRWVLGWINDPKSVLKNVAQALKPGGKMVLQEYQDWSTHEAKPHRDGINKAIQRALKSFKDYDSELDIGKDLPEILTDLGLNLVNVRQISKLASPNDSIWQWPKSFYFNYFPKLVEMNYLTPEELEKAFEDLKELEAGDDTVITCPLMVEVIAEKSF